MSRKFRPQDRPDTYESYCSWYRATFDGEQFMLSRSEWEAARDRYRAQAA